MQVTVKQGQTIFDIAIQTAGSVAASFAAALLNGIGITDDLTIGVSLSTPPVADKRMLQHYQDATIVPATAINEAVEPKYEGIGYWIIEDDFVVS